MMNPTTVLYVAEVVTVVAAVLLMVWLRRAGDHVWAAHQRRQRSMRAALATVTITVNTAPFVAAVRAAQEFGAAMAQVQETMRNGSTLSRLQELQQALQPPRPGRHRR